MNKGILLTACFMMAASGVSGQTIHTKEVPLQQVLEQIEKESDYKLYWNEDDLKNIKVSFQADLSKEPISNVMERLLRDTQLKATLYQGKYIYLLKGQNLQTSIPVLRKMDKQSDSDIADYLANKGVQKANSENIVYKVGRANGKTGTKSVQISGTVTSFKTGEPMIGVNLVIRKPQWNAAATDARGHFVLHTSPGAVEVEISGMSTEKTYRKLMVYENGSINIELEDKVQEIDEVLVTANKRDNVQSVQMGVQKLVSDEMRLIPTVFGESDVLKIAQLLPGVKTMGEASSGLNVRGGATDQNLILFGESTIYNPTHLFGFFSALNSGVVSDMELYKSTVPAKYGGRISSVLEISNRTGNKEKIKGMMNIGLLTSSASLEGPINKGKTSFLLSGRTTYSDWLLKMLPEKSGYSNGKAGFYDANLILSHTFNKSNYMSLSGYYSNDRFQFIGEEKYSYNNFNTSAKFNHSFSGDCVLSFTVGSDHYGYQTINTKNENDAYRMTFDINQYFLRANLLQRNWDGHKFNGGLSTILYHVQPGKMVPYKSASQLTEKVLDTEKAMESAAYLDDEWKIDKHFSVSAGIRYTLFQAMGPRTLRSYVEGELPSPTNMIGEENVGNGSFQNYQGPEFRLSTCYAFNDDFSIKLGVNTMRQFIHKVSNTLIMSPTDTWKLSDRYIKPQTGVQYSVGLYKNLLNGVLETSVEAYYKTLNNYLDYRSGAQLLMNEHLETDVLPTEGRAYGVELMVKKTKGHLNGWLSYTYSRTELKQNDPRIIKPVNDGDWYPAEYDKPHEVKFVGNYQFTKRYSMSCNIDYSTGRPLTVPVSMYYDHTIGASTFFYTRRNEVRVPDYFRVDFAFNILPTHRLTATFNHSITLGVYNLTGRRNAYSIYYINEGEDGIKSYKMSIFGAPIPYITYNIKF